MSGRGAGQGATTRVPQSKYTHPARLCHGIGQFHTDNPSAADPRALLTITIDQIEAMLERPVSVAKAQAPWVIPSDHLSRVHAEQRQQGLFWGLWFDIDETAATFHGSCTLIAEALPGIRVLAYTTRSATQDQQKLRGIIPLSEPIPGRDYRLHAMSVNDRLQAAGIIPDRATERAGQLCYLPNKGVFYRHAVLGSQTLHPGAMTEEVDALSQTERLEQLQRQSLAYSSQMRRLHRAQRGVYSVVDAFNRQCPVDHALQSYGYVRKGNRWLSPNSESGTPGVIVTEDGHWLSSHGSDTGIGQSGEFGCWGDAFDLFVAYEHRGDFAAAVRAANLAMRGGD